jgi:4-hydroxy-3-polyprenylbenzoate decarboxylase
MKLIIGISGASGVTLAVKFIKLLPKEIEKYVIISEHAKVVFQKENNINILDNSDISEITASGSFKSDKMIILPCSMNTLAKISIGIADNLITRTASVMLKERRKLILAPREMPYSTISLENMTKLSQNGVIIAPPVLGYYSNQKTLEDMENFMIGKWFDLLDIEHNLFERWKG